MEKIERQGTINAIDFLFEDSYKELYLKKCDDYEDLKQLYNCEVEINEELKQQNNALKYIVKNRKLFKQFF